MGRKSKTIGDVPNAGSQDAPAAPQHASLPAGAQAPSAGLQSLLVANPALVLSNPLLAMQMLNSGLLGAAGVGKAGMPCPPPEAVQPSIDPDVQELCDHFHIEDRHLQRLNEIMKNRQDTFEGDLLKLWEKLEDAREPAGLLVVKMREMEEGTFVGKQKADKELAALSKKYGLDNTAESRLADILARFDAQKKTEMYEELERHLEVSNRPSAMVMMLLRKLSEGQPLGRPGPAAPGSYLDRKMRERQEGSKSDRERDRDRDRRDRDRPGGRAPDRDRRDRDKEKDKDRDRDRDKRSRSRRR